MFERADTRNDLRIASVVFVPGTRVFVIPLSGERLVLSMDPNVHSGFRIGGPFRISVIFAMVPVMPAMLVVFVNATCCREQDDNAY